MVETAQSGLLQAALVARDTPLQQAPNGVRYAAYGEITLPPSELDRLVQAVPRPIAAALTGSAYYFVPLALGERPSLAPPDLADPRPGSRTSEQQPLIAQQTLIAALYSADFSDQAVCHRNVRLGSGATAFDGVFISTRLLGDRFALAFEFFINVGHAFVDTAGVPERFAALVWSQALADVRGETSQDAWESRNLALVGSRKEGLLDPRPQIDEKARLSFVEAAFADAVAIYQLSLAVDFDYAELREREYPLLAPQPLADRLRLIASLFPPNPGYEFAIRYRRRS